MLEYSAGVDRMFHALANGTRRAIVDRLSRGPTTVGELARPLPVTLAAVVQHLQVLEESGLVTTSKHGRVRTCQLDGSRLARAEEWIAGRRALWERRFDRLDALLDADATTLASTGASATDPAHEPLAQERTERHDRPQEEAT